MTSRARRLIGFLGLYANHLGPLLAALGGEAP
jgi:hypothetical protein